MTETHKRKRYDHKADAAEDEDEPTPPKQEYNGSMPPQGRKRS